MGKIEQSSVEVLQDVKILLDVGNVAAAHSTATMHLRALKDLAQAQEDADRIKQHAVDSVAIAHQMDEARDKANTPTESPSP